MHSNSNKFINYFSRKFVEIWSVNHAKKRKKVHWVFKYICILFSLLLSCAYCIRFPFLSMFMNWNEEFSLCSRKESSYLKKMVLVDAKFLITWVDKRCNISNTNIYGIPSFRKQPLWPHKGRGKVCIYPHSPHILFYDILSYMLAQSFFFSLTHVVSW